MLTFPGAPPDIGSTWVHYSFSTTFGSRRVRTSVCVYLVVDERTCTCVPSLCVHLYTRLSSFSMHLSFSIPASPFCFFPRLFFDPRTRLSSTWFVHHSLSSLPFHPFFSALSIVPFFLSLFIFPASGSSTPKLFPSSSLRGDASLVTLSSSLSRVRGSR